MQITVESKSPAPGTVVSLVGKLDAVSTADVEKALIGVIEGGETKLVVDCAKLEFISSAGLRSLIMAIKRMKTRGGTIALAAMQRDVKEIINISGLAARQSGSLIGSMRNVSVAALTKNLADQLGPHGINVTVVHPGLTRTEATPGVIKWRAETSGRSEAEIEKQMAEGNVVRRFIDAEDIAAVVTFLASPRSVAITGDAVAAGGGAPRAIYY